MYSDFFFDDDDEHQPTPTSTHVQQTCTKCQPQVLVQKTLITRHLSRPRAKDLMLQGKAALSKTAPSRLPSALKLLR